MQTTPKETAGLKVGLQQRVFLKPFEEVPRGNGNVNKLITE